MTRTTKALKRLGVAGLVAATIGAGVPALIGTAASAATGDTIAITPTADSASAGTCNPFTVTVKDKSGNPATSTVDVVVTQRNNPGLTDTFNVTFCTTNTGTPNQAPANASSSGSTASNTDTDSVRGEFTPDANGQFTFGIQGTEPGTADVLAYLDNNNNNTLDTGENYVTAVKTFTAGTAADVRTITATPKTATNFIGETHTISAVLKNSAGDTVANVTPTADITSGPNSSITPTCTASDNDGVSKCTYSGTQVGTDTIVVFLNQTNADNNPATPDTSGPDAGEPQDTVQKTWQTAPSGETIDLTCGDSTTPRTSPEDCINQLSSTTETFSALVKKADGSVVSGGLVDFAITGDTDSTNAKPTLSASEVATDANGVAKVTLTNSKPSNNEVVTVTATIRGQSPTTSDSGTKTWRTTTTGERNIVLTPESATTTAGTFRTFTAKVTNVYGEPVSGAFVQFTETGPGAFRNGNSSTGVTTDINGVATVDVTSGATETGTETITATIFDAACSQPAGTPAGATAGNCTDTSTNTFVAGTPSATPSSPSTGRQALTLVVNTPTINAGTQGKMTVTGSANQAIQLVCYTRPSTTYKVARNATINAAGDPVVFTLSLGMNTRCFAQYATNSTQDASPSGVINVKTVVSIFPVRNSTRNYTFQGHNLPKYAGQLITLYYVNSQGQSVRKGYVKTDSTGIYHIPVTFVSNGTFTFYVRTGQTLTNAAGESAHVSVTIH